MDAINQSEAKQFSCDQYIPFFLLLFLALSWLLSRNIKEMLQQRDEKVLQFMNLSKKLAKIETELNSAQENNIGISKEYLAD